MVVEIGRYYLDSHPTAIRTPIQIVQGLEGGELRTICTFYTSGHYRKRLVAEAYVMVEALNNIREQLEKDNPLKEEMT